MAIETVILGIALIAGFYMAWSIGANDVANAMGTSVGSGALTIKRAVIIAAVLEFAGAFLVGTHVSETIRKGIINPEIFTGHELDLAYGMIGALLAAAIWLQLASYYGWPVSTTHSIVGAVLGFG
ncbi:MAG: inorganic phosphate transporter, partial [Calditrichaeota bacterium]|nr:inorganic phosphate transporter [Calditrichota bacterium]